MGDPAESLSFLPCIVFEWSVAGTEAGDDWFRGQLSDARLLLAPFGECPGAFVRNMNGRRAWRYLLHSDVWNVPAKTAYLRTDQPGLIRLLDELGAERGFVEPSGQIRYRVAPAAFVAVESKLRRTYAPEFPSCLRGDQFPVMAEKHGLRVPRLEGSLCR